MTASMPVELLEFKLVRKGAAIGVARVRLGRALILHDVMVLSSNGKVWANAPGKPLVGKDGLVLKNDQGKVRYSPIVEWKDKESRERFSAAVIAAVEAKHGAISKLAAGAP